MSVDSINKMKSLVSSHGEVPKQTDDDALDLANVGYVQEYSRKFNLATAIGFTVGISGTWEGIVGSIGSALSLGGPASLLWGFMFASIGNCFVAASLAEMASIYPTAGGQYHWAAILSPKKHRVFIGWVTAWTSLTTCWIAIVACGASVAVQVQAYALFANPDYDAKNWHVTLIFWLVLFIYLFINLFGMNQLKYLNYYVIFIHIAGYLAIIISTSATKEDFNSAAYAFGGFSNLSGWPDGLAWCIGILTSQMGFLGLETPVHFAEEIKNAAINVPRAIFWPVLVNGLMTFPFLICICFIVPSSDVVFGSSISGSAPSLMIWYEAFKNIGGSIFVNSMSTSVAFTGGVFAMGAAGRITFAMARDKALPPKLAIVNDRWEVSIRSLATTIVFPFIIGLIYIWNSTALYGVMAGMIVSYQITYIIPIALAIPARKRGMLQGGKWNLGRWAFTCNVLAILFSIFIIVFSSFPTINPVDASNMNYSVVMLGFGWFLSIIFWVYGRKHYEGPTEALAAHALEVIMSARSQAELNGVDPIEDIINIVSGKHA